MNRREALAALVSLPALTRVSVATLAPTDVIVAECTGYLTDDGKRRIAATLQEVWPGRWILVCDDQIKLKVVSGSGL